jgi:hypothetical protein
MKRKGKKRTPKEGSLAKAGFPGFFHSPGRQVAAWQVFFKDNLQNLT